MESSRGQSQEEVQAVSHDPGSGTPGGISGGYGGEAVLEYDRAGEAGDTGVLRAKRRGYVYLIGPYKGCYKIGKAKDPDARLASLGLPRKVGIVHLIASDCPYAIEEILHIAFAHRIAEGVHRCSVREWFRLDDSEVAAVLSIPFANTELDIPESLLALKARNGSKGKAERLLPGGFMLRLPESFRTLLDSITSETHRTLTVEVQLALVDYAKKYGKVPPQIGGDS